MNPTLRSASFVCAIWLLIGVSSAQTFAPKNQKKSGPAPGSGPSVPVDMTRLGIAPTLYDFGPVASGEERSVDLVLSNQAFLPLQLSRVRFLLGPNGNSAAFRVEVNGSSYAGGTGNVTRTISPAVTIPRRGQLTVPLYFLQTQEQLDQFTLQFQAGEELVSVEVSGLGGHTGDPYLHVVIDGPKWVVDYDGDGSEALTLDGTGSHTNEPGHADRKSVV